MEQQKIKDTGTDISETYIRYYYNNGKRLEI